MGETERSRAEVGVWLLAGLAFVVGTVELVVAGVLDELAASFAVSQGRTGLLMSLYALVCAARPAAGLPQRRHRAPPPAGRRAVGVRRRQPGQRRRAELRPVAGEPAAGGGQCLGHCGGGDHPGGGHRRTGTARPGDRPGVCRHRRLTGAGRTAGHPDRRVLGLAQPVPAARRGRVARPAAAPAPAAGHPRRARHRPGGATAGAGPGPGAVRPPGIAVADDRPVHRLHLHRAVPGRQHGPRQTDHQPGPAGLRGGGILGALLGGRAADRWPGPATFVAFLLLHALALVLLPFATGGLPLLLGAVVFWCVFNMAPGPAIQKYLVELSPDTAAIQISLNTSAIQLGVALGAFIGAILVDQVAVRALLVGRRADPRRRRLRLAVRAAAGGGHGGLPGAPRLIPYRAPREQPRAPFLNLQAHYRYPWRGLPAANAYHG